MEERKEKKIGAIASFIRNVLSNRRSRIKWWTGDKDGGAFLHDGNSQLLATNVRAKDILRVFFTKEREATVQCFGKMPFLSTWIIIVAEINARIKEQERRQAEKYARFMRYVRNKRD